MIERRMRLWDIRPSVGTRDAWAIGTLTKQGLRIRRVVWGKALATAERRDGESIGKVRIIGRA